MAAIKAELHMFYKLYTCIFRDLTYLITKLQDYKLTKRNKINHLHTKLVQAKGILTIIIIITNN
mgnify:CR=1 FL=1